MQYELVLSPEDLQFRDEVRQFLKEKLPKEWGSLALKGYGSLDYHAFRKEWQRQLYDARLAVIGWPEEYGGRGAGVIQQLVYANEMSKRGAPDGINNGALHTCGPTLMQWGSEWQKEHFLPPMLKGEDVWCQGFSEPDAGSDLASLKTRAVPDGDEFVINGSKIWTSYAHLADWCFMLVRTDPDVPKHAGISYLLVDMHSPGITLQPIITIHGEHHFNQVFLDNVRVHRKHMVGPLNEGWRVATTSLKYERAGQGDTTRLEKRLRLVTKLAKETQADGIRRIDDPLVQEKLARFAALVEGLRQIGWRNLVTGIHGGDPGPESAIAKLLVRQTDQEMAEFGLELLGQYGTLVHGSPYAVKGGNAALSYLIMRAASIGGGTPEVARNVIGERLLGLPRD